jgi:hypothetical protein
MAKQRVKFYPAGAGSPPTAATFPQELITLAIIYELGKHILLSRDLRLRLRQHAH